MIDQVNISRSSSSSTATNACWSARVICPTANASIKTQFLVHGFIEQRFFFRLDHLDDPLVNAVAEGLAAGRFPRFPVLAVDQLWPPEKTGQVEQPGKVGR